MASNFVHRAGLNFSDFHVLKKLLVARVYNGRGECLTAYSPSDMCA